MALRISGKHMDIGDSLRERIDVRIDDAVDKYFGNGYSGHVTVEKEGNFFSCDCMLHLDSGVTLQASARESDANTSFDRAAERIETRLRRYTRKLKNHSGRADAIPADAAYTIMSTHSEDEEVAEDFAPVVVAESVRQLPASSVAEAVMHLELMDEPVHVFKNAGSGVVNVVFRRADGNVGWIDPASVSADS